MGTLMSTNLWYALIFWIAFAICYLPEIIVFLRRASSTRKEATIQDRNSGMLISVSIFVGFSLAFNLPVYLPHTTIIWHRTTLFIIGIVLMLLGVAFRWYAIWVLGRYFTRDVAVSADQQVVQRGPYHFIRHPSYSGALLTIVGVGLALTNWASLLALIVCCPVGFLYRVHVEEQALSRTIGEPYVQYMQHTRRFIPFIY